MGRCLLLFALKSGRYGADFDVFTAVLGLQGVADPAAFGTTFCQLWVHFVDNTASMSTAGQVISEGLNTSTVSALLEASPGLNILGNRPPMIMLYGNFDIFWGGFF